VTQKVLSERAKYRLRAAAALLRSEGASFNCPRDQFYLEIQSLLAGLGEVKRTELKAMVDWVEQYDTYDRQHTDEGA
jgi:hypothetical protein